MPLTRPFPVDSAFPNAVDIRRQQASLYPREGVIPDPITTATAGIAYANGGWQVGARLFTAVLKRGGAPFTQTYGAALISNDSQAQAWTIPAAPASGSRIDLLWIRATDPSQGDSMTGAPTDGPASAARAVPVFGVTSGTADAAPVAPALPAGAELIASVNTPSGATSISGSVITQSYTFAHVIGATIYVRNLAERDALTNLMPYDTCYTLDEGLLFQRPRINNTWRLVSGADFMVQATTASTFAAGTITNLGGGTFGTPATNIGFDTYVSGIVRVRHPGLYQATVTGGISGSGVTAGSVLLRHYRGGSVLYDYVSDSTSSVTSVPLDCIAGDEIRLALFAPNGSPAVNPGRTRIAVRSYNGS